MDLCPKGNETKPDHYTETVYVRSSTDVPVPYDQ